MADDDFKIEGKPFNILYDMGHSQSADRQRMSAEGWRQLARQFEALSGNLTHYRDQVAPDWNSKGGQAFREKMTDVITILDDYAADIRIFATILDDTADAVVTAQADLNKLNNEREQYIKEKEDYRDNGDGSDSWWLVDGWRDVVDVTNDTYHRIKGDSHIDAARMKQFDQQAEAIMRTLQNKYWTANTKRPTLAEYKGPIVAVPIPNVPGAPGAPAAPPPVSAPVPVLPPSPPTPPGNPPTATPPPTPTPPGVPVVPPPPGQGPVLVGNPAAPVAPVLTPPVAPGVPNAPGIPGTPVPPVVPGLNTPGQQNLGGGGGPKLSPPPTPGLPGGGKGGKSAPGMPPPPGRNSMKKSGVIGQKPGAGTPGKPALPPSARTGKGVIGNRGEGQRPGLPPAAGQQKGKPGQPGVPPGQQRRGATPPRAGNGTGRNATPPPAGRQPGTIGRRPGADDQGRHGTPPPAQRRDRRNVDNQPIGPDGIPGTIGPAGTAWGTPPPTIGNTSRPTGPASLDHDAIGGRPSGQQSRRQQPGADGPEYTRRPGLAARDAAPPVLGRERPAAPRVHGEPPPARRQQHQPLDDDYGVSEQESAAPVIQTPERHERDERGPAIGQAG
ncbi:hypothetical protein AB0M02_22730 [Actinoplanes sp. NPDC051861]|uniref:hypothetical protein n=1 Tax=Actinoplanes sp. NPDC051861 TaxID=3155170 RepID=UPI00342AC980